MTFGHQYDLQLGVTGEIDDRLFMVWPLIVEHRIDEDSPFWDLSADGLQQEFIHHAETVPEYTSYSRKPGCGLLSGVQGVSR